jgi:hypothetical protein
MGKKLLVLLASLVASIVGAELILRHEEKTSQSLLLMDREERPYDYLKALRYFPGEIVAESKCNSLGYFDDQEFVEERKPGIKRVVSISDSMGCSAGAPCRYHALTKAENLDGTFGDRKWEIYNISVCGINPDGYLHLLVREGLQYDADFFLVGFFVGNDLDIRDMGGMSSARKGELRKREKLSERMRIMRVSKRLYRLYRAGCLFGEKGKRRIALETPLERLSREDDEQREKERARKEQLGLLEEEVPGIHPEQWWMDISNEIPPLTERSYVDKEREFFGYNEFEFEHPAYQTIRRIYREAKRLTNGTIAVILFPDAYQVDDRLFGELDGHAGLSRKDRDTVYNNVKRILAEEDIDTIEFLEELREGQKKYGRVYHKGEWHLNYWGNHIAAGKIGEFLADYFAAEKAALPR